jgi:DNA-binding PadR family transcriptional regulator
MNTSPNPLKIPALGYALLGLLQAKPASGYDLRKIFSSTSMKTYSDSPGAIYPALQRLEKQGLVRGTIEQGNGLRRRQVFHLTGRGTAELKKWIRKPITPEDLTRGYEEIMLRFAFSETAAGMSASVELLTSLQAALKAHVVSLHEEFEASHKLMPTSGRLAFESGIGGTEYLLQWTEYAIATYDKEARKKGSAL